MSDYQIYARNESLQRIAQIDDFAALSFTQQFNSPGYWEIIVPAGGTGASQLTWRNGIIIARDGTALMSGPVRSIEHRRGKTEDAYTISGPGDLVWLADRLAFPVPSGPPYTAQARDKQTGAAETVIKYYVDYNAGPNARADRQVPGLTIEADATLGNSVVVGVRFGALLEVVQGIALVGGDLGVRIVASGSGAEFQVYAPTDKTSSVVFSEELGNIVDFQYREDASEHNYVIVGGQGVGVARTFFESGDSGSIVKYGRQELFLDRRDTNDSTELYDAIATALDEGKRRVDIRLTPLQTGGIAYLTDYELGDDVTMVIDGVQIQERIREITIRLSGGGGEEIRPVLQSAGVRQVSFLGRLSSVESRAQFLETEQ